MPTEQELDQIFLAAAERAGGIQPLLTSFFGFLHRRTDFYIEHARARLPTSILRASATSILGNK